MIAAPGDEPYVFGEKGLIGKVSKRNGEGSLSNCPGRKPLSVRLFRLISRHHHDISKKTLFAGKAVCDSFGVPRVLDHGSVAS
jgi:hypothetical protein